MKIIEIIKKYCTTKPIDVVDTPEWLGRLLKKPSDNYIVLRLSNKHIYGPRSEWLREMVFYTGRVVFVWQTYEGAWLLIGPDRVGVVGFVFDDNIAAYYKSGHWPNNLENFYERPFGSLRYKHRIDFEYNNPEHDEFEKELLYHPTIAEVTAYIRYGYHANPTKEKEVLQKYMDPRSPRKEAEAIRKYAADLEKEEDGRVIVEPSVRFLGITNISPHGYLVGEMPVRRPDVLPATSILDSGDIVVSLFGGNFQNHALGSIGKVAIVDTERAPCFINQTMASMRAKKPDIDPHFLLASIRSEYFRRQMQMRMKPSNKTQTLISLEDFCECRVKIPSKAVMKKIEDRYKALMNAFRDEQKILEEVEKL